MQPTIGRKVYFNPHDRHAEMRRLGEQPFDATVVFVHENGTVNLLIVDHVGMFHPVQNVTFVQPEQDAPDSAFAYWMPAQVQIAKQQEFVSDAMRMQDEIDRETPVDVTTTITGDVVTGDEAENQGEGTANTGTGDGAEANLNPVTDTSLESGAQ